MNCAPQRIRVVHSRLNQTFGKFNVHCLALHEQFRSFPEKLCLHVSENLRQLATGRNANKKRKQYRSNGQIFGRRKAEQGLGGQEERRMLVGRVYADWIPA